MTDSNRSSSGSRPFLGMHMKCCNVYVRAYITADHSAFAGKCPRCGMPIRVPISREGGSKSRFFEAS